MRAGCVFPRTSAIRRVVSWTLASLLASISVYPVVARRQAAQQATRRLEGLDANADLLADAAEWMDPRVSQRVQRLGPLLAGWESIGGCGAGGTGGTGTGVKWIGRNTTGGFFHSQFLFNYLTFKDGYNFIALAQIDRDIDTRQKWNAGVIVPFLYKYYNNYLQLTPPVSISNAGLGDINIFLMRRFGPINATSVTAALGFPTGTHNATYKFEPLTQDKQLGLGNFTGSLLVDHIIDESWGLINLGALAAYRGGTNDLGSYRAPMGSIYTFAGYFLGRFVPALGLSVTGFAGKDQDRGIDQDLPLLLLSGNASIEWSTDDVAILGGVQFPFGIDAGFQLQPWVVALGVSVSPF
jgi:hypothetical protein